MKTAQECLANNLKRIRKDRGLTQSDVAELLDISVRSYQKYEQQEAFPDDKNLDKLCLKLRISFVDLFDDSSAATQPEPVLLDAIMVLQRLTEAGPHRRATILYLLFREEKYLENLPNGFRQAARALQKAP